ncbi:uncharacterized protein LOC101846723 [Aplysia californica]|uniref:Uncharacterized protein LOC101846723 n=1 Tax=Aplysia californica TaxID=6500 RepID=A0ABM0JHD9_APLCA|nr:uncharacterized protein LOC101846723 [Aplysia californica]
MDEIDDSVYIEFFKAHPCLWNPLDPGYLKDDLRRNALQRILIQTKSPVTDNNVSALKKRFSSWITGYTNELKKVNQDPLKAYTPAWDKYNSLDAFLNPLLILQRKIPTRPANSKVTAKRSRPSQGASHSSSDRKTPRKKKKLNPSTAATPETVYARFGQYIATTLDVFNHDDAATAVEEIQAVIAKYVMKG